MLDPKNTEHTLAIANLIIAWVSIINIPLLLLIVRMLWGFNNRLTILEVKARHDGEVSSSYRRYYRRPQQENEK